MIKTPTEKRQRALQWGLLCYFLFLFVTVLIRSAVSGITYDEACTYLGFGLIDLFRPRTLYALFSREGCIANNHWLNTILIRLLQMTVRADYSEFVIRLPSLCFFALYLVGLAYAYRRGHCSLPALLLLVSNYYLLEFYGLARGYGMANTCVFFACLSWIKWRDSGYSEDRHLRWLMLYMSLGVFANTIVLLLYPAFGLLCLYRLVQRGRLGAFMKSSGVLFGLFMLFSLVMVKYHMNVSSPEKPLYTGGEMGFFDSVIRGCAAMFVGGGRAAAVVGAAVALSAALCLAVQGRALLERDFSLMLILFVVTNVLLELALRKGYITGRVLLPFYAFVVFCFQELYAAGWERLLEWGGRRALANLEKARAVLTGAVCAALVLSCLLQTDLHTTREWNEDYKFELWVAGEYLTGEEYPGKRNGNAPEVFYRYKYDAMKDRYLEEIS